MLEKRVRGLALHFCFGEIEFAHREARVQLRILIERVDLCLGVAERAVVVNEADHLAIELKIRARNGRRACFRSLSFLRFRLRDTELKAFEKRRPCAFHRAWIFTPLCVFFFQ